MRKPKIFTATFEESLNFEDDPLLKWQNQDVEKLNKHILGTSKEDKMGNYDLANITDFEKVHKAVLRD